MAAKLNLLSDANCRYATSMGKKVVICPLCGGSNECALAQTGNIDAKCWCHEVTIKPAAIELAQMLKNRHSCICQRCATATVQRQVNAKLYCTEHCYICKEAGKIISDVGITAIKIDILDDDNLFVQYRKRIPVLQNIDNDAELDWPFDIVTVLRFIK